MNKIYLALLAGFMVLQSGIVMADDEDEVKAKDGRYQMNLFFNNRDGSDIGGSFTRFIDRACPDGGLNLFDISHSVQINSASNEVVSVITYQCIF